MQSYELKEHFSVTAHAAFWKTTVVTDAAKQCFACHEPKKDQGYVYSTYIP